MKTLAFVVSLVIIAVGAVGILAPPALVWIAQHSLAPVELYSIAAVRVAFGLLLISVASASRAPKTLRVVAFIPLVAGIATPFVGIERAQTVTQQGSGVVRLSAVPLLALGGFIAYACAPARRAT
ncbi:MAG: hypothetical protein ABSA46_21755 [Thermodesulfovibrionales bacterium]